MVKEWGFRLRPDYSTAQLRSAIIIGYPFDFSTPVPPIPVIPVLTNGYDLNYFRSYTLDLSSVRQIYSYTPIVAAIADDDSLSYFRQYLGRV